MSAMLSLVSRDLKLALRSGMGSTLGVIFFLMVASLVPFAVGPDAQLLARIAFGMIWIAALLAALLTLDRLFAPDAEDGTLDLYLTIGVSGEWIGLCKIISHWLLSALPLIIATPLAAMLLGLPATKLPLLLLSLCLGTPALSALGAIAASLSLGIKRGGMLTGLLLLPLLTPVLIFAVGSGDNISGLLLLAACSLVSLVLAPLACGPLIRLAAE
jgi:heme exporter protein B